MKSKKIILLLNAIFLFSFANAQNKKADSTAIAKIVKSLLDICKNVDFADTNTTKLGTFYKAAQYIIYQGNDEIRKWKSFANYRDAEDKKGVDQVCTRINESVNRDSSYTIVKYFTEKESEGIWHILMVSYKKKEIEKKSAFAFLKIGNRFGLGDID